MEILINDALDPEELAREYKKKNRIQILDILHPESAENIYKCLTQETPWGLTYMEGDEVVQLSQEALLKLTDQQKMEIFNRVHDQAKTKYQFLYNYYPMLEAYLTGRDPGLYLHKIFEFLNSPPFQDFVRTVTGLPDIAKADAHATLYTKGHFLKYHTDEKPGDGRRAAYVLNFTKGWGRDWGGYLQFFDKNYNVEEALRPVFNALNMFTVPLDHSVNYIPGFCGGNRCSVTGWLRTLEDGPPQTPKA